MEVSLESSFPSGRSWSLYYHDTENKKWTLDTFDKLGTVKTWRQFYELISAIEPDFWSQGMFFFMVDPIPPLWENAANIRGGNYSMRIGSQIMMDIFTKYCIASILGEGTKEGTKEGSSSSGSGKEGNIIHGVSMTPKKGFFVIKIWNKDSTKFNNPDQLVVLDSSLRPGTIIYTPFVDKRM
jgi:hypothetical protein